MTSRPGRAAGRLLAAERPGGLADDQAEWREEMEEEWGMEEEEEWRVVVAILLGRIEKPRYLDRERINLRSLQSISLHFI